MKKSFLSLITVIFAAFSVGSVAAEPKAFECVGELNYQVVNQNGVSETRSVEMLVSGLRSSRNTLVGPVAVRVGQLYSVLNLPQVSLSETSVMISGKNNKDGVALKLNYLENTEGTAASTNSASVEVKTVNGLIKASSDDGELSCEIVQ